LSENGNARYYSFSFILRLLALLAFIAALCVAEGWLNLGTGLEWAFGGLALYTLADLA
jgi:hypothetical protein